MNKLVREVGNWVTEDRFWDRENELRNLIELLDEGANILITGQRRMGKTSLLHEVGRRLDSKYLCLQLDIQWRDSPADVIADICVAIRPHMNLWNKTKEIFRNITSATMGSIDSLRIEDLTIKIRDGLSSNWQDRGDSVIACLAESEKPVIMFIDEFPLFISRILKGPDYEITPERLRVTDLFISWIRATTIKYRGKLRLVLAGSIGLEPILRQARLSAGITTFTAFEVSPWDYKTASGCLQALANNYKVKFKDTAIESILESLGCYIPQHVQMFFSCVYDDCKRRNNMDCYPEDIHRLYQTSMLSTRGHAELSTYEERLKLVLGKEIMPLALEILTEAAVSGKLTLKAANILGDYSALEGQSLKDALIEILGVLEHDGYIQMKGEDYFFVSKLVRDWWRARFGFQFIPALERTV